MAGYNLRFPTQTQGDTLIMVLALVGADGNAISLPDGPYTGALIVRPAVGAAALLTCQTSDGTMAIDTSASTITLLVNKSVMAAIDAASYPYPDYGWEIADVNGIRSTLFDGVFPLEAQYT